MSNLYDNRAVIKRERSIWLKMVAPAPAIFLGLLALWIVAAQITADNPFESTNDDKLFFEERTGVRLLRLALVSGGGMIDLQYQILDPDKALAVHDDENPPALIDEAKGLRLATPFHDHGFRELKTAVTYHELIVNGDGHIRRGSRVTLTIGEERLEHVPVE